MTGSISPEEDAFLEGIATRVVELRLDAPAIFMLESMKPLSFVGSQAMVFFAPLLVTIFDRATYERVQRLLERREALEALIVKIEAKV